MLETRFRDGKMRQFHAVKRYIVELLFLLWVKNRAKRLSFGAYKSAARTDFGRITFFTLKHTGFNTFLPTFQTKSLG